MIWDDILAKLDRICVACEKLATKWAPDDVRNPGPPFSNQPVPTPVLPPEIIVPPPSGNPTATLAGYPTDNLPFNVSGNTGAHVEVRTSARLRIDVPHGFVGRKQLDVSHIAPGAPERVSIKLNGTELQVPFGSGLAKMPSGEDLLFVYGITYYLDVAIEPVGFGCSLQLR